MHLGQVSIIGVVLFFYFGFGGFQKHQIILNSSISKDKLILFPSARRLGARHEKGWPETLLTLPSHLKDTILVALHSISH